MLAADYCDGHSTRVRAVTLSIDGADLVIAGESLTIRAPFGRVRVDERLGRAPRKLRFDDGSFCEVRDLDGLERMLAQAGVRHGIVDRLQRHLPAVLLACVACAVLAAAAYLWGLPWAAAEMARRLPASVGRTLGAQALEVLDRGILEPSKIPAERRSALERRFQALPLTDDGTPPPRLLFRASAQLGANAFALTDGTIVLLDDLVTAIEDDDEVVAVVAHELGHVHGRHGLRLLLQSSAVAALATFYFGDVSQLLAAAPAAVVQARYSRELEQSADDFAADLLRRDHLSPGLLADALETLAEHHPGTDGFGYLSSHPPTDERLGRLRQLAR